MTRAVVEVPSSTIEHIREVSPVRNIEVARWGVIGERVSVRARAAGAGEFRACGVDLVAVPVSWSRQLRRVVVVPAGGAG